MLNITLDKFQGPLGLLLQLIENQELDITEVSLAKIADQYVDSIKNLSRIDPGEMADFLVVAAKLLLLKSKALLPYLTREEEEEIEEFAQQLKMYKEFLEVTKAIEKTLKKKKFMFAREFDRRAVLANLNLFSPPKKIKKEDLQSVFKDLIKGIAPRQEELEEEKLERKITIEEKILSIQRSLVDRLKFSFNKILGSAKSKTEIIVSFLAVLELIKQKDVAAEQGGLFSEIVIRKT